MFTPTRKVSEVQITIDVGCGPKDAWLLRQHLNKIPEGSSVTARRARRWYKKKAVQILNKLLLRALGRIFETNGRRRIDKVMSALNKGNREALDSLIKRVIEEEPILKLMDANLASDFIEVFIRRSTAPESEIKRNEPILLSADDAEREIFGGAIRRGSSSYRIL